jgi:hypothetical protein
MSDSTPLPDECRVLTDRIQKLEMARALADSGQHDKALDLLRRLRAAYPEPDKRKMIDWLISDLERRPRK